MRIRKQFAGAFVGLLLIAAFAGLGNQQIPSYKQSDKVLHFVTFFALSVTFYWIIETNRRRVLQFSLIACPAILGAGSEIAQGILPNGREFDYYDILANVLGSLSAIGLCTWYHKRMLERKRQARGYQVVPGEGGDDRDLELGEGMGSQETDVSRPAPTLEEEVDNWDENAEDWEDDEPAAAESAGAEGTKPQNSSIDGNAADGKK
ncbi:hypothetical protein BDY21DRAFT_191073 [Lineolata rhizophorae]|uniref:VanZ-like domain-containing protein n=1 Tax=Lineolata rhizophorae TaxID=578093 RepID=A0A6A6P6J3_9PEZI|nr:hypothetical protein BDY21DRAFT_191073 [Lineolata rhizophorae]